MKSASKVIYVKAECEQVKEIKVFPARTPTDIAKARRKCNIKINNVGSDVYSREDVCEVMRRLNNREKWNTHIR